MSAAEPVIRLDSRFSSNGATARPWSEVLAVIEEAEIFWLSTVRRDKRPHVAPLPAIWLDRAMYFCTGPEEQKTKNIEGNPRCALTTGTNRFRSGLDVVVEGKAARVVEEPLLVRLAAMWKTKLDWDFEVVPGGFRDPVTTGDAGAGIGYVFAVAPAKVLAFGKGEPFSQTRYSFRS